MLAGIIKEFNWLDVFIIIILFRICYISLKSGFPTEVFKLLGTVSAIYLSLHYYIALSDFIHERLGIKFIPLEFMDFLSFLILALVGYLTFMILRKVFDQLIKMETVFYLARWGGLILGITRGILLSGLIAFILVISGIGYFKNSVTHSYLGRRLFYVTPATYKGIWDVVLSKLMTGEKFNKTVLDVQENLK